MQRSESHKLNATMGYYVPSAFQIKYYQEGNIVNTEYEFILFHEYIHFLQDISTNYGKTNLCNYFTFLKDVILELRSKSDDCVINLPLQFAEMPLYLEHKKSNSIILGNTKIINNLPADFISSNKQELHGKSVSLYDTKDVVYTLRIGGAEFYIGAFDVLENMAYLLQRLIYSDKASAPTYPYKTIEIVTQSIYPEFSTRHELVCALCELSLSASNPGRFYFDSLLQLKRTQAQIDSIDDLLKLFSPALSFRYLGSSEFNIEKVSNDITEDAVAIIKELFPDPTFSELINYTERMFRKALSLRVSDPLFITRGVLTADPRGYYFSILPDKVGVPLIFDKYYDLYMPETAPIKFLYFSCISIFLDIFTDGEAECELYTGCKRNMDSFANSHKVSNFCLTAPWKLCEKEKLCPLASLLAYWGIDKKNYQYV